MKFSTIARTVIMLLPVFAVSCGKAPDTPELHRMAQLETAFSALKNNDYAAATEAFEVLLQTDPDNEFLDRALRLMRANAALTEAEKLIAAGRLAGARTVIQQDIRLHGSLPNLNETEAALADLIAVRALIDESGRATTVETLENVTSRLRQVMQSHPALEPELRAILSERLIQKRRLELAEQSKMLLDLWFDADENIAAHSPYAPVALAELELYLPDVRPLYNVVQPEGIIAAPPEKSLPGTQTTHERIPES